MSHSLVLTPYLLQLFLSLIITGILSKSVYWFGADKLIGIQKYHITKVSRLGGLSITFSILIGLLLINRYYSSESFLTTLLMLAFAPILIAGLLEDITHLVKPKTRFFSACLSSLAVLTVTQVYIERTDLAIIDVLLKIPGASLLLSILVIVGFLNSINIIDGFNGVASGSALIMTIAICVIAYLVDDYLILRIAVLIAISIIGFMCWNWPYGKIFLGDGGAYLLGIWIVELGILLQYRSTNISPLAPVLIGSYPMIETLFTIYRRKFLRSKPISHPDALHLHTLIYRRLISKQKINNKSVDIVSSNSRVAPYIWLFIISDSILAIIFYDNTNILFGCILLTYLAYIKLYLSIVKFKTYKLLYFNNSIK